MKIVKYVSIVILLAILTACGGGQKSESESADGSTDAAEATNSKATAVLGPANNSGVSGTVSFEQIGEEVVKMTVQAMHISPGTHALHLHENGDCSAPDASSAGGHWNPTAMPHGKRGEGDFHKGDIINLEASADSVVNWSSEINGWTIGGPVETNIVGRSVIIHVAADDFTSQPSGNAGSRVACGVINEEGGSM
ncbi:MAG: superoxide dismutase family protein [Cyclobacteriaceae bacterium]